MIDQNSPMELPYVAGSLGVWTLFDYMGEVSEKKRGGGEEGTGEGGKGGGGRGRERGRGGGFLDWCVEVEEVDVGVELPVCASFFFVLITLPLLPLFPHPCFPPPYINHSRLVLGLS
jgi:hypothetical protein